MSTWRNDPSKVLDQSPTFHAEQHAHLARARTRRTSTSYAIPTGISVHVGDLGRPRQRKSHWIFKGIYSKHTHPA